MSTERETTRVVRSWLEEGVTALPDRVLDAVLDQLPATPQRRPWWRAWRSPYMNNPVRIAIAAAAVLVVALVGYEFLPSNTGSGGPPTTTPSAAPSPTLAAAPTSTVLPTLPGSGPIGAGKYTIFPDGLRGYVSLTMEVPAGWEGCCAAPGWIVYNGGASAWLTGAAILVGDVTGLVVYGDSCRWQSSPTSKPVGADAFAAALAAQPGRQASQPRAVTVAGLPGVHVRLTVPDDLQTTTQSDGDLTFVDCDAGEYRSFDGRHHQGLSQIDDFYFVDVGSRTLVFDIFSFPGSPASAVPELEAMLASVEID